MDAAVGPYAAEAPFNPELAAMRAAYLAIEPLDESGRRRALMWLAAKLDVDMNDYDLVTAREALASAEGKVAPKG